jgi:hypothetical protein
LLDGEHCLMMSTAWWWALLGDEHGLVVGTAWWWGRLDDEDGLMMRTTWWWERLDDENDLLMMRTIYLSTLNWADKEFFLTFLYIASLEQAWQNPSNINPRVGLRALISPTRSDTNPRVGFELLSETQPYGQAIDVIQNVNVNNSLNCMKEWSWFQNRIFYSFSFLLIAFSIRWFDRFNNVFTIFSVMHDFAHTLSFFASIILWRDRERRFLRLRLRLWLILKNNCINMFNNF